MNVECVDDATAPLPFGTAMLTTLANPRHMAIPGDKARAIFPA
jgi:hypothetical protein